MAKITALVSLVIALGLINLSIVGKEQHLANGKTVFLVLAPLDPRSLMQGDYMALRFQMERDIQRALSKSSQKSDHDKQPFHSLDGYVVVRLDDNNIATYQTLYTDQILADNEVLLRYRLRHGAVKFATNAFFFQEGHAERFQAAEYGQFKVHDDGELLLITMHDANLVKL